MRRKNGKHKSFISAPAFVKITLRTVVIVILPILFAACRSPQKIDMRGLVPKNGLVYLEINDLAKTLESLTAGQAFQALAAEKPDFSALENLQLAIIVTSFQTSGEDSVLKLTPRFVAVAETHAWSWQARSFVENQLDKFVRKNYGEAATLEIGEKPTGKFYTWRAADKRQVFAFVEGSLIYFGNDAAAIEKCPSIKRGEAESLLKNESLTAVYSANNLVFAYVSTEGIREIGNLAGVSAAVGTSEEAAGERNFISEILPQILQKTVREIVWTANKTEGAIEDKIIISTTAETAPAVNQILATGTPTAGNSVNLLPPGFASATRYTLKTPSTAWRELISAAAKNIDETRGGLLIKFSNSLLEPYGITDAETFLSQIDSEIVTAQFDAAGEKSAVIVTVKDATKLRSSISKEINFQSAPLNIGATQIWISEDKTLAAAFTGNKLILGDGESVLKCARISQSEQKPSKNRNFQRFAESQSVASTFGTDYDSAEKIVEVLAGKKTETGKLATFYSTETRLNASGIERVTVSDFGMIGTILKQLNQ